MNRRSPRFNDLFAGLPDHVQALARGAFRLFCDNPSHPSLRHHALANSKRGSHVPGSFSVSVSMRYRAIYYAEGGVNVWYWIGTHAEYDKLTGKR